MKPNNWDKMSNDKKQEHAGSLLGSERGKFIIAQALHIASKEIMSRPIERRETSNAQDMDMMLEALFPVYYAMFSVDMEALGRKIMDATFGENRGQK